ncbi:MAG: PDC sensor domain-containing protein [Cellulosilyticaceae bacterium]
MRRLKINMITKIVMPLLSGLMICIAVGVTMTYRDTSMHVNRVAINQLYDTTKTIKLTVEKELQAYIHALNTLKNLSEGKEMITDVEKIAMADGLKMLLNEYPGLFGAWVIIEPEAMREPETYINQPLHDDEGRFAPYFDKVDGKIIGQTLKYHKKEGERAYFHRKPLDTGKIYVTKAITYQYKGEPVTVISICLPFEIGGQTLGVMGIDIEIGDLAAYVASYEVYEDGYAVLFDRDYSIIAHPRDEFIGSNPYSDGRMTSDEKSAMDHTRATLEFNIVEAQAGGDGELAYKTFVPVVLHEDLKPYIAQIVVPMIEVYAESYRLRTSLIIVGIGMVAIISVMMQRLIIGYIKKEYHDLEWLYYLRK